MNRLFVLAVAVISYCFCFADTTCRIGETNDTVEAQSVELKGNSQVCVSLGNDSGSNAANVCVTVEVTYKWGNRVNTKTYEGKALVLPQSTTTVTIPISESNGGSDYTPHSVKIVSLTGSKCQ